VAIGPDGWVWCGNEDGDLCRIAPDGSAIERVATTGGFILGMAFDADRALFACDLRHAALFRLDLGSGRLTRHRAEGLRNPNFPVIDRAFGRVLVSDSHAPGQPGPGVWAFDLDGGAGRLWCGAPFHFANGLAMRAGEAALYLCETFAHRIRRIAIAPDGSARAIETFAADLPGLPDGIAFDRAGNLVVGCYEPSRLLRLSPDGTACTLLAEDPSAHTLCHPTNIAFAGDRLFAANLGRWHIAEVAMDIGAEPLWRATP
jgi:sugar lactone lactonase YvrE